jgi:hypothetical protein
MKTIKVLVACEFSGVVRNAFNAYSGIQAISCDLLPAEDGRDDYHYQGNVLDIIDSGWDMMISHQPCTFLANSGVRWLYNKDGSINIKRWKDMEEGAEFFNLLWQYSKIPFRVSENPIQHKHARMLIDKPNQIIQPWMFGHPETKATCLWITTNLPHLQPTNIVSGREQRVHKLPPSADRWKERSRTYSGIAEAMAAQWIPVLVKEFSNDKA